MSVVEEVRKDLERRGYIVGDFKLHHAQGMVNRIYKVETSRGPLLVSVGHRAPSFIQEETKKRIFFILEFFRSNPRMPTTEAVCHGKFGDTYYVVQKFIEGDRLADREDKLKYLQELADILAYLHSTHTKGFGHFHGEALHGKHDNWLQFLKSTTFWTLEQLHDRGYLQDNYGRVVSDYNIFFEKYKDIFLGVRGRFVHGDINFQNILVGDKRINAVVDFEWSLSGDPAFEFVSCPSAKLKQLYFDRMKNLDPDFDEGAFEFRIKLYEAIHPIWSAYTFRDLPRIIGYDAKRKPIKNFAERNIDAAIGRVKELL